MKLLNTDEYNSIIEWLKDYNMTLEEQEAILEMWARKIKSIRRLGNERVRTTNSDKAGN